MARILVADDNPLVRRIAVDTLAAEGHEVESLVSGSGLIERVSKSRPDLLLLDTGLPDDDVDETCAAILAASAPDSLRIVLLAGPLEDIEDSEIRSGVHSVIQKPLDAATLLDLVKDRSAAEDESGPSEGVLEALVSEALGQSEQGVSREDLRAQIDEVVTAAIPSIVDRITERVVEHLKPA